MLGALIAACSDDPAASPPTVQGAPTLAPVTSPTDDGVLRIGLLRPTGTATADISASTKAGVDLAIADIRSTGVNVELLERNEGDALVTSASLRELIENRVDAIIGPMSSNVALATLSVPVDMGITTCSPTASALALDDYPDRGLFFRTVASDSLQAKAIAQQVNLTGASTAGLVNLDDGYGRPFADAVEAAARAANLSVTRVSYLPDDNSISAAATTLAERKPAVTMLIADGGTAAVMAQAIAKSYGATRGAFVVNDAARRTLADLPASVFTTTTITALAPRATASGVFGQRLVAALQDSASGVFAENAFDCVNLIALAAAQSGSTRSADIASNIVSASAGGSVCTDYSTCVQLIDQRRNIDYGPIRLGAGGDVDESVFDVVDIVRGGETKQRTVTVSA